MNVRHVLRLLAPLTILIGLVAIPVRPATSAVAQGAITFEPPVVADPIHTYGEPDIGVNPVNGHVFVSGPGGTGQQRSLWNGSVDGGHTFRVITPGTPPTAAQGTANQPGGGDTDIIFDHTGKQYFSDLYDLLCFRMAVTPDDGATVTQQVFPGGCAGTPQSDRQWFGIYDPPANLHTTSAYTGPKPLLYFEYNGTAQWTMSTDGLNWTAANADGASHGGPDSHPAVDQVTGKVLVPVDNGPSLQLNIGTPTATGTLNWLDNASGGTGLIHISDHFTGGTGDLFSGASIDSGRNLWVVTGTTGAANQYQIYVSVAAASSGWTKWATPVQVSAAPSLTNIFPWMVAGGPGRADAVWYGADKAGDPSTPIGQNWNVFMNQVVWPTDANGAVDITAKPSTQMVKVSPHPMKYNDICLAGTGCIAQQGNRNLADFFVINIDRSGAAEIVYDDTSNGLLQTGFTPLPQLADHAGAPVVTVARQASGPGLFGYDVSGPLATPSKGMSQKAGSAKYGAPGTTNPLINGTEVPGMDVTSSAMNLGADGLKVTMNVVDLSNPSGTISTVGAPLLQYVTRWQMGNTIYYAAMENNAAGQPMFYAGAAQSTDLCSVSACEPHVIDYAEPPLGTAETGDIRCPATPSATSPCTLTINVNPADVGGPTAKSLFESIGGYAFAAAVPSVTLAGAGNGLGQVDTTPLEIGGICCYNYQEIPTTTAVASPAAVATAAPVVAPSTAPAPLPNTATHLVGVAWTVASVTLPLVALLWLWTASGRGRRRLRRS